MSGLITGIPGRLTERQQKVCPEAHCIAAAVYKSVSCTLKEGEKGGRVEGGRV